MAVPNSMFAMLALAVLIASAAAADAEKANVEPMGSGHRYKPSGGYDGPEGYDHYHHEGPSYGDYYPKEKHAYCNCNVTCPNTPCGDKCPQDTKYCSGECVNTLTNRFNCGECGVECPAEATKCKNGVCQCPNEDIACEVNGELVCTDIQNDENNCGDCGKKCTKEGDICDDGKCKPNPCEEGEERCDGQCINPLEDEANCGGCVGSGGVACGPNEECKGGNCCGGDGANCEKGGAGFCCEGLKCKGVGGGAKECKP